MIKVSIVEDTPDIRERMIKHVSNMPTVDFLSAFDNGEEALRGLLKNPPDLVIMDIGLPGMSGTELLARIIQKDFQGNVLMFTVFDSDDHLFRALELGAIGYILKEEGSKGVVAAIEEFQSGGAPMSRSIAIRVLESFNKPTKKKASELETLTEKQSMILHLMSEGLLNKEIADKLNLTEGAIKQQNNRIYRKLAVNNRVEAIRIYLNNT